MFGRQFKEPDMSSIKHNALVLFAAVGVLASAGAEAKAVAPERACSGANTLARRTFSAGP